jgi:hypothetical protein
MVAKRAPGGCVPHGEFPGSSTRFDTPPNPTDYNEGKAISDKREWILQESSESRKTDCEIFQRWVTKEVLPSIRRTGSYHQIRPQKNSFALENAREQLGPSNFIIHALIFFFLKLYVSGHLTSNSVEYTNEDIDIPPIAPFFFETGEIKNLTHVKSGVSTTLEILSIATHRFPNG